MREDTGDFDARLRQLTADIAARLRSVCTHLHGEEFEQLVMDIALMKVRFEVLEDLPGGLRPLRLRGDRDWSDEGKPPSFDADE